MISDRPTLPEIPPALMEAAVRFVREEIEPGYGANVARSTIEYWVLKIASALHYGENASIPQP